MECLYCCLLSSIVSAGSRAISFIASAHEVIVPLWQRILFGHGSQSRILRAFRLHFCSRHSSVFSHPIIASSLRSFMSGQSIYKATHSHKKVRCYILAQLCAEQF